VNEIKLCTKKLLFFAIVVSSQRQTDSTHNKEFEKILSVFYIYIA
jgi:hypothetical protein